MKKIISLLIAMSGPLLCGTTLAADSAAGGKLHASHCGSCHGTGVYTRDDRRVTSAAGLHKQVNRCQLSQGLQWFDDDIDNVTSYLNESFYHFK